MYSKLLQGFKDELVLRQLGKRTVIYLGLFFFVYLVCIITVQSIYDSQWWISIIGLVVLIIGSWIVICSVVYFTSKSKLNLCRKDFFRCVSTFKKLIAVQPDDITIIVPMAKRVGINTRPKILEAIRHFQLLLSVKYKHGFAVMSAITLAVSIISILISATSAGRNNDILGLLVLLIAVIIYIAIACVAVKIFFKPLYDDLSENALLVRIEETLSEIWMKQLIK